MDYLVQSAEFHFIRCHVNRYTHERNIEELCVIKFPELQKFVYLYTKFTKLKLIEFFAHATLVTMIYSQSYSIVWFLLEFSVSVSLLGPSDTWDYIDI